jgi:hypothetical protein
MSTLTYTGQLVVLTCWCGMRHAVPSELREHQLRQHNDGLSVDSVYCPLGHSHVPSGEGEAERLRKQLEREQQRHSATRSLLQHEERSHAATRGHLTRTKRRVGNGVCPCCHRTFQQLSRHMKAKHPEYADNGTTERESKDVA